jgi:threonyl-tRNA synthetase
MGKRIRDAEVQKVPAMLVFGDRDMENRTVSLRRHGVGDLGAMSLENAITLFKEWEAEIPNP